ncbi:MAG: GNAT family N-acetyltransferase [Lachnospiraceae bacterium]|nr:GNAT family N-acetyltransferase [Lachnospiraceae bacterium]
MEIVRLDINRFESIKAEIKGLIKESMVFSFPKYKISPNYYDDRLSCLETYIKDRSAIIYVALDEDKIIGWIWCHEIYRFDKKRLHVSNFAVNSNSRNKGVGNMLIAEAEKYAQDNGYSGLDLLVTKDNKSAVSFYFNHGYEVERYLLKKEL